MNIKTTVNINARRLQLLREFETRNMVPFNKVLVQLLLASTEQHNMHSKNIFHRVTYQERARISGNEYSIQHISLPPDVYEKCIDMRKVYKLSVSLILAICIDTFLDTLVFDDDQNENMDNYNEKYYLQVDEVEGNWRIVIFWGKSKDPAHKYLRL